MVVYHQHPNRAFTRGVAINSQYVFCITDGNNSQQEIFRAQIDGGGLSSIYASSVNNTTRSWNDSNGNFVPDCDLRNFATNGECGPIANSLFAKPANVKAIK